MLHPATLLLPLLPSQELTARLLLVKSSFCSSLSAAAKQRCKRRLPRAARRCCWLAKAAGRVACRGHRDALVLSRRLAGAFLRHMRLAVWGPHHGAAHCGGHFCGMAAGGMNGQRGDKGSGGAAWALMG